MDLLIEQFFVAIQGSNLLVLFLSTVVGIIIGAIPGLTVNMAVALSIPLTIHMSLAQALCMIFAIYVSGIYGGSISAILVNAPGTPAAAATTLDGYPMTQQGRAGKALQMALFASFIGGIMSVIILVLVAQNLATVALKFGPAERSTLMVFALTIVGVLSGRSMIKGLMSGALGLLVATVGADPMLAIPRFTFGMLELEEGFGFIPVLIGLFAVSEMLVQAEDRMQSSIKASYKESSDRGEDSRLTRKDILLCWKTIIRSGFLGAFIGMLPGIGATVACFFGYGEAKRASKDPDAFGRGTVEGVAAAESANNAVAGATLIPLLALSIPGDALTAILYGALLIQGVQTGPLIFRYHLDAVYLIYVTLTLANIFMVATAASFMTFFKRVAEVPKRILFPIIFIFCVVGSFAMRNSVADMYIMMGMGVMGYFLRTFGVPLAPLLIGYILANPFEEALRQALVGSEGSLRIFVVRPIAAGFLILTVLAIWIMIRRTLRARREKAESEGDEESEV
jgi:putative tricarboxylic transport membrane protein